MGKGMRNCRNERQWQVDIKCAMYGTCVYVSLTTSIHTYKPVITVSGRKTRNSSLSGFQLIIEGKESK